MQADLSNRKNLCVFLGFIYNLQKKEEFMCQALEPYKEFGQ